MKVPNVFLWSMSTLVLGACSNLPTKPDPVIKTEIRVERVEVPVRQPCVAEVPEFPQLPPVPPDLPFDKRLAIVLLHAESVDRHARKLAAILEGCK